MHVNGMENGLREGCKAIVDARKREKEIIESWGRSSGDGDFWDTRIFLQRNVWQIFQKYA